ncbi:MAG: class I SAM-dependent methyltransferase, partial [Planctomycetota bacterium]
MERKQAFDTVADQYDAVRPGYPEALVERVVARALLTPDSRLLEIGCGTAIATLPWARRGHRILCLEPGPNLAAIARRKLAAFGDVSVREEEFEAWAEEPDAFDLVYCAQAWHHLDPDVRYRKAARTLRATGTLAVYANWAVTNFEEGQEAYRSHVPEWADRPLPPIEQRLARAVASMAGSGCFRSVATHRFRPPAPAARAAARVVRRPARVHRTARRNGRASQRGRAVPGDPGEGLDDR